MTEDKIHISEVAHWDETVIVPDYKRVVSDGARSFSCGCYWQYSICPAKEEHVYIYCDQHKNNHEGLWEE